MEGSVAPQGSGEPTTRRNGVDGLLCEERRAIKDTQEECQRAASEAATPWCRHREQRRRAVGSSKRGEASNRGGVDTGTTTTAEATEIAKMEAWTSRNSLINRANRMDGNTRDGDASEASAA